uniref:C2 calcium dependent domain containing 4C n=1 Tax=Oncorhynchus kisutch TaxID=8019 RepID=A0A8C7L7K2_ONCKI
SRKTTQHFRGSHGGHSALAGDKQQNQTDPVSIHTNIITPGKIPDFFIPHKLISRPRAAEGRDTNAEPQSQTDMSLPYVPKAQTSYRFSTLVESPHSHRKESIFHRDPSSLHTSPGSQTQPGGGGNHLTPSVPNPYRYFSGGESDTCSSAESSPITSPLLTHSASLLRSITQETQAKVSRAKHTLARRRSLSTNECSSPDTSPSLQRRRLRCPPSPTFHLLQREHSVNLNKGGTLRLSTHYDAEAAPLRVRVLAAEDLYENQTDGKSINCCVSLYLNPGKQQKQRSTIINNSRNPMFNEDFFFDAVPAARVKSLAMKMKVVNKGTSLKRDVLLGEREVLLSELLPGI